MLTKLRACVILFLIIVSKLKFFVSPKEKKKYTDCEKAFINFSKMIGSQISGKISSGSNLSGFDDSGTLDEPVSETILRDVKKIGVRIRHVLLPYSTDKDLRNWDLWGPLILCLALACTMSFNSSSDEDAALVFTAVFVIVWVGAAVVTVNAALLGGNMYVFFFSFFFYILYFYIFIYSSLC